MKPPVVPPGRRLRPRTPLVAAAAVLLLVLPLGGQMRERVDFEAVYRLKDEGLQRSRVMDIASYLTDVYGPRVTGTPSYRAAAEWAQKQLAEWGLANVRTEPFPFGRGWTNERFVAHVVAPSAYPLIGYPKVWTPGTNGPVTAEAVAAVMENEGDFERFKGKLAGKIVLVQPMREVKAAWEPLATRFADKDLAELTQQPVAPGGDRRRDYRAAMAFASRRAQFLRAEGAVATLEPSRVGDGGTVFVQGGGSRDPKEAPVLPQIVLAVEHYGRIWRTLEKQIPVRIELDVRNTFHEAEADAFNITAEIPGTDKADEVVMLGAHFDAWHAGTGATDNAAGSAVMMEAMRILKATGLKMRRTVRLALWGGEEQGLLGSRAYVKTHFADRETMALKPEHAKLAAYFNVDNGTGAIRGVYLQGNEAVAPIFSAWMEPLRSLGMTTLTIRNTGGTDHLAFDEVGLPGFQFIQDEVEYDTRTHHSNMDVWERLQAPDMMKNAVIVAAFVYHAAVRDEKLPRKPLPAPQPERPTPSGH
jgi:hypothetical protein